MVEYALIAISIALLTGGQVLHKRAASLAGKPSGWTGYLAAVAKLRQTWWGIGCIGLGSVSWLGVLYHMDVGKAYPLLSLGFVAVVVLSPDDSARAGSRHAVARGHANRCRRQPAVSDMKCRRQKWVGPVAVTGSIVLSACAQLSMKAAMMHASRLGPAPDLFDAAPITPILILTIAGFGCYGASLVSWLIALSRYPLSLAYPLLSLSYVLVYLAAGAWPRFAEPLSGSRTGAIAMIVVGVVLVARSSSMAAEDG